MFHLACQVSGYASTCTQQTCSVEAQTEVIGGNMYAAAAEEGLRSAGKFVPWKELLSLSPGHTWLHQGARPSFIIDANLFRAD